MRKLGFVTRGFTLIELVVVIVILGILAAVAIPRFISLQSEARAASIKSIAGSTQSTLALIYAKAILAGQQQEASGTVLVGGANIALKYGYPPLVSISSVFELDKAPQLQSAAINATSGYVAPINVKNVNTCRVIYTEATSATNPATIVTNVSNCS